LSLEKEFDVFLSHNSVDKPWALELKDALVAAKLHAAEKLRASQKQPNNLYKVPPVLKTDEPEDFIGRRILLNRVRNHLVEFSGHFLIFGKSGCGKSTLAKMFASQHRDRFSVTIFQVCGQRPTEEIAAELAKQLELGLGTESPAQQVERIKSILAKQRSLLILDDVCNAEIGQLLPPATGTSTSVLCTSRSHSFPWMATSDSEELKSFTEAEVKDLFKRFIGPEETRNHWESLLAFANRLEHLPVAIGVAGDLVAKSIINQQANGAKTLTPSEITNAIHNVSELFETALIARPEPEQRLLKAMASCVQEGFRLSLATEICGLDPVHGKAACEELINALLVRQLDRERQQYQLHPLLHKHLSHATNSAEFRKRHATVLLEMFAHWENRQLECREVLTEVPSAIKRLWESDQRKMALSITDRAASVAYRLGELTLGYQIPLQIEGFLEQQPDLESMNNLGGIYANRAVILKNWGRLEHAMALFKQQEAICLKVDNKDGLQRSYGNQALILKSWWRLGEAIELVKRQESICLGLDNKEALQTSRCNHALIREGYRQLGEAMLLLKKSEIICQHLGDKNGLQICYGIQAMIFIKCGRLDSAMPLLKMQEAICLELRNKDDLQTSYCNQALILKKWEDQKMP